MLKFLVDLKVCSALQELIGKDLLIRAILCTARTNEEINGSNSKLFDSTIALSTEGILNSREIRWLNGTNEPALVTRQLFEATKLQRTEATNTLEHKGTQRTLR